MSDSPNSASASEEFPQINQDDFNQLIAIRSRLLNSHYLFDQKGVWFGVVTQLRELYDCELVSLFLVDHDDRGTLSLTAQSPRRNRSKFSIPIASIERSGITAHAAAEGQTMMLNAPDIQASPFLRPGIPDYLPSGTYYSALFVPLKNRKGRLIGLLRLQNKSIGDAPKQTPFSLSDRSAMELLASEVVVLLENAHAFETLRNLIGEIQSAGSTSVAVQQILRRTLQLLHADHAKLALWSQSKDSLVFAGVRTPNGEDSLLRGAKLPQNTVVTELWKSAFESNGQTEHEIQMHFRKDSAEGPRLCGDSSQSAISVTLRVHDQLVGVLHLESEGESAFDELDCQILKAFAENVSIAIQSMSQPWPFPDDDSDTEQEGFSLGETEGFYHSLIRHVPLVMWRKDKSGKFIWVNDQFCETVQRERRNVIGKYDHELFPVDLEPQFLEGDKYAMENKVYEDPEEKYVLPNGETRYIHVIKTAFYDLFGNVAGTQGLFLDVTGDSFRQLFVHAPIGFHELDSKGRILHVNESEQTLLGYEESHMKEQFYWNFSSSVDREVTQKLIEDQLAGRSVDGEWHPINLKKADGTTVPVLLNSRRVNNDDSSNRTRLLCAVREISAGAEIEEALRDPDTRYLARIRELDIPVFCIDKELRVTFANDALLERVGRAFDEIRGKTSAELFPQYGERYDTDNRQVLVSKNVIDKVEFHLDKNGVEKLVRVLKFPILNSNGAIIGVQGVFWEYKEQEKAKKQLSDALNEAKEEYRRIVNDASEGIFQAALDGRIIAANPAMFRMLGCWSEEELVDWEKDGTKRFANGDDRLEYKESNRQARADRRPREFEYQMQTKDGYRIWVSESVQKVPDHSGEGRLVGFVENITERKVNAEKIATSLREKEEMVTMLAHQLRSPAWQAYERAHYLVNEMDPHHLLAKGQATHPVLPLATIRGLARKTRAVAWSIDMMSRLAQGNTIAISKNRGIYPRHLIKTAREAARDVQLIRRVSTGFSEKLGLKKSVPDFEVEVDDSLQSSLKIMGDQDLIEQCVGNVIENAFKYSKPTSKIRIVCQLRYASATLTIRNLPTRGLEIDEDTRVNCRKKDWRSAGAGASDADGVGLGLWFVDKIMEAHGGRLEIDTTDSSGWNEFRLIFKLTRA